MRADNEKHLINTLRQSTRKNIYRHIWHSGVCTITNYVMFATNMHNHSLLIVSAFSFLLSRAITRLRK